VADDDGLADERMHHVSQRTEQGLAGILRYSTEPLVSRDVIGDPASCIFDSGLTLASGRLVKVFGWYDNEWGCSTRLVDLTELVGAQL
jgi:glyceraldehyde 3-phosphate dehydrogenase